MSDAQFRPTLDSLGELECAECEETVETGYFPAREADDALQPVTERALCETCGFTEVGMNGCAPRLRDFDLQADALVRVDREGGQTTGSVTERA